METGIRLDEGSHRIAAHRVKLKAIRMRKIRLGVSKEGRVGLGVGGEQQDLVTDNRQVAMQQTMPMLGIQAAQ